MLFQRLYNWIKYKSLPVSFFFKNRLFIEKDTKHKRIYSLLGNVFRNSKWSNLELPNIKNQFRTKYSRFLYRAFFIFFFLVAFFYRKYLNNTYVGGQINFLVWLLYDAFDYYLAFITWIFIFSSYALLYWFYSYTSEKFLNLPSASNLRRPSSLFYFFNEKHKEKTYAQSFQKNDLKNLSYFWLNNDDVEKKEIFLENFFASEVNQSLWNKNYIFFNKLFKVSYLCNLMSEKFTVNYLHFSINSLESKNSSTSLKNFFLLSDQNSLLKHNFILSIWYLLNNSNFYFARKNQVCSVFTKKDLWNITNFYVENTNFYKDPFYLFNWNFNNINFLNGTFVEFFTLISSVRNQTDSAKWNRWLYKYSILHRRILKNSHKLTITKRLLTSGFYDRSFISRNTWNSHRWEKINKSILSNLNYVNYSNFFMYDNFQESSSFAFNRIRYNFIKNKFVFFSAYENSFFWVNKRFYFLNTISANFINSSFYLSHSSPKIINLSLSAAPHFFYLSKLSSMFELNTDEFFFFTQNYSFDKIHSLYNDSTVYNHKDVFLSFQDHDFFNNEVLDISYWISLNTNIDSNRPTNLNYTFSDYSDLINSYDFIEVNLKTFYSANFKFANLFSIKPYLLDCFLFGFFK